MNLAKDIVWSPKKYKEVAVVSFEAEQEMLARLDWMTIKPRIIVDLGCGVGGASVVLKAKFPDSCVISFDTSQEMLTYAQQQVPLCVNADAKKLPLRDQSVDLIFSNLLLPWDNLPMLLRECRRIIRPEGLLMLTALGPDTLQECKALDTEYIPQLVDMHDLGDGLMKEGFVDPVLDVNHYITTYKSKEILFDELTASGMFFSKSFSKEIIGTTNQSAEHIWDVTYEVIFAHAFGPSDSKQSSADGTTTIPLGYLRSQLLRQR